MLYPQNNPYRQESDLSGFWDIQFDPEDKGYLDGWQDGIAGGRPIAVPGSWNDQFEDGRDFLGPAWFQTRFNLPWGWSGQRIFLRFNSINYLAEAWLNGIRLGTHEGGHLPFEFELTDLVRPDSNRLVVRVDGRLTFDHVPPGNVPPDPADTFASEPRNYPATNFDFFPFCGIHRPVLLYTTPRHAIQDITVQSSLDGSTGIVNVKVQLTAAHETSLRFLLNGQGVELAREVETLRDSAEVDLVVPNAAFWSPSSPALYVLTVELARDGVMYDSFSLTIGIRTIVVAGDRLLLNGQPVYLTGFGRHEDFPITGRGLLPAVIIKDYALMHWVGANSFRTTHYPYSEQMMELADRLGFLVIDETPAVGLYFHEEGYERRLELCRQYLGELIARDKNHPSVILWSLANEPHSERPEAKNFFYELYELAKSLDPTRPVTVVSYLGKAEAANEFCNVVCLNRYYGWYSEGGQLDRAMSKLSSELDELHDKFPKPVILSEFGTDTIPGYHAQPPEMFSEEYQVEFLTRYIELLNTKPYIVGQHVWNLCDFKTSQGIIRMGGMNYKGVFTRDRRPKMAAHALRHLWCSSDAEDR